MLATACRPENLLIFACLHAAMIRCVTRLCQLNETARDGRRRAAEGVQLRAADGQELPPGLDQDAGSASIRDNAA